MTNSAAASWQIHRKARMSISEATPAIESNTKLHPAELMAARRLDHSWRGRGHADSATDGNIKSDNLSSNSKKNGIKS